MLINNEEDIIQLISEDKWMMNLLKSVQKLNLPDWWICAGFVRSKVWDVLHDFEDRTVLPDIDVIYYDTSNTSEDEERRHEESLNKLFPNTPWSVKNQARMHIVNNISPYTSSVDAISKFPETATALGVKLDDDYNLVLVAPHGINDLVNLQVKPTPFFQTTEVRKLIYEKRVMKKNWQAIWNMVEVIGVKSD
ncbi:nucleotidyltransferase family protein [Sporosarcina sp. FA9]|uniref:nucleotidyltransferase family protein n=1 Tax=Sporosarcina sp. FA9 TaxID=3413030 RepID=UPI003F65699A